MATVPDLTKNAQDYVKSLVAVSDSSIANAITLAQNIGFDGLSFSGVPLPTAPVLPTALKAPKLSDVPLDLPTQPSDQLLFQDISPIVASALPVLSATSPTITLPNKPNQLADFGVQMPAVNTAFVFPDPPSALMNPLVSEPTIVARVEPTAPQVLLPGFSATLPTDAPIAPTDLQATFQNAYAGAAPSTITMIEGYVTDWLARYNPRFQEGMATIEAQLAKYLAGGTGLSPATENAIYERSRSKSDAEARRVRDGAYRDVADRGFTLPNETIASLAINARQAAADTNAAGAREIVVMAAEYEQKNLQFAVTTSANLRTTLLNAALSYHQNLVSINGQALEYAKSVLGAVIEVYNIAVKAFEVKLESYRAEAAVYDTRVRAAMSQIELYRAQIQALEALTQVDRARIDIYRARIDSLQAYASVYKSQIDAVLGRASLEKMRLDVFNAQVQAFTAQVQAKNGEWQGYRASIDGQQALAALFGEQVRAFGIQSDAWAKEISAKAEIARAQAATNQARADNFRAVWAGYSSVVTARGEVAKTKLENNRQEVIAFQAESQAQVANAQVRNEYYRSTGEIAIKNAQLSIEAIFKSAELKRDYGKTLAQLSATSATVHGSVAGAALSGMNTLVAQNLVQ